jgi:hypothetical protein
VITVSTYLSIYIYIHSSAIERCTMLTTHLLDQSKSAGHTETSELSRCPSLHFSRCSLTDYHACSYCCPPCFDATRQLEDLPLICTAGLH